MHILVEAPLLEGLIAEAHIAKASVARELVPINSTVVV